MNNLVKEMQSSLKSLLLSCYSEGNHADPNKYPSQILCLADSVHFTSKCGEAIGSMKLPTLLTSYKVGYHPTVEKQIVNKKVLGTMKDEV